MSNPGSKPVTLYVSLPVLQERYLSAEPEAHPGAQTSVAKKQTNRKLLLESSLQPFIQACPLNSLANHCEAGGR